MPKKPNKPRFEIRPIPSANYAEVAQALESVIQLICGESSTKEEAINELTAIIKGLPKDPL